jgi:hypothetical protein
LASFLEKEVKTDADAAMKTKSKHKRIINFMDNPQTKMVGSKLLSKIQQNITANIGSNSFNKWIWMLMEMLNPFRIYL